MTVACDPSEPQFDQSAFVADLLNRQDQVIEGLGDLAEQIDTVIEEINKSRQNELAELEAAQAAEARDVAQTVEATGSDEAVELPKADDVVKKAA